MASPPERQRAQCSVRSMSRSGASATRCLCWRASRRRHSGGCAVNHLTARICSAGQPCLAPEALPSSPKTTSLPCVRRRTPRRWSTVIVTQITNHRSRDIRRRRWTRAGPGSLGEVPQPCTDSRRFLGRRIRWHSTDVASSRFVATEFNESATSGGRRARCGSLLQDPTARSASSRVASHSLSLVSGEAQAVSTTITTGGQPAGCPGSPSLLNGHGRCRQRCELRRARHGHRARFAAPAPRVEIDVRPRADARARCRRHESDRQDLCRLRWPQRHPAP